MAKNKDLVFIVEDDKFFNQVISKYLSSKNVGEIKSFYSGEDCLNNISSKPDIILLDYELPGRNGISVLKELRKKLPNAFIIILSGQTDIKVAIEAIREGAFDYIVKDENANETALNKIDQIHRFQKVEKDKNMHKNSNRIFIFILLITWASFFFYLLLKK